MRQYSEPIGKPLESAARRPAIGPAPAETAETAETELGFRVRSVASALTLRHPCCDTTTISTREHRSVHGWATERLDEERRLQPSESPWPGARTEWRHQPDVDPQSSPSPLLSRKNTIVLLRLHSSHPSSRQWRETSRCSDPRPGSLAPHADSQHGQHTDGVLQQ